MTALLAQTAFVMMLSVCPASGTTDACLANATVFAGPYKTERDCDIAALRMPLSEPKPGVDEALYCEGVAK